jgi:hypothetical protein
MHALSSSYPANVFLPDFVIAISDEMYQLYTTFLTTPFFVPSNLLLSKSPGLSYQPGFEKNVSHPYTKGKKQYKLFFILKMEE